MKSIVIYFSRNGENYVNGQIKNLKVGNTEIVAKMISELTGGDTFKIEPVVEYSNDYSEPMVIFTFIEHFNFEGKTIKPFCTHEGSGMGHSESDIKKLCPNAKIEKGLPIHGADVENSKELIENWI